MASWLSRTKIAGSGFISQRHGSADPDPHQNVMDPEHWFQEIPSLETSWRPPWVRQLFKTLYWDKLSHFRAGWCWWGFARRHLSQTILPPTLLTVVLCTYICGLEAKALLCLSYDTWGRSSVSVPLSDSVILAALASLFLLLCSNFITIYGGLGTHTLWHRVVVPARQAT